MSAAFPRWGINHVIAYGQSYANGWEGFPPLTREPRFDTLMFGHSVRPRSEAGAHWEPVGDSGFHRLRATLQEHWGGDVISPDVAATMPANTAFLGETVLESAVNHLRARSIEDDGALDPARRLLASTCAVGGRPIEALSRGATPDLFNRLRDCVRRARAQAERIGESYGVAAMILMQGEHNNFAVGGTADPDAYASLFRRLYADIADDVVRGIAGQEQAPPLFTYQTGGLQATETNPIPQAQLETALSLAGAFMVGPAYHVTTRHDHPDANGYRWLGAQFGKVMHRVLARGEAWRPLHPLSAAWDGGLIRLIFHVPHPPLVWGRPLIRGGATHLIDRGFEVFDARGPVSLADVEIVAPTVVCMAPGRALEGDVRVRYAAAARGGCGCLHDSDPTRADDSYVFAPGQGHWPAAELPSMIGQRYPLMNWCVAFTMKLAG